MPSYGMFRKEDLFAAGDLNVARTASLFKEFSREGDKPLFHLSHVRETEDGLIDIRKLYLAFCVEDPTETNFAETVFGDYKTWKTISSISRLQPYLEEWRETAEIKRKQMAFQAILDEVKDKTGRNRLTAARYLIDEPWKGRTKEAKEQKTKTTDKASSFFQEDIKRLKEEGLLQ